MRALDPTTARMIGAFAVALLLHAIGTALIPGYSAPFAIRAMLVIAALLAVASIGQTLLVILGGIDLSIPFVIGFANVVAAQLYGQGWPFWLVCLLVAALAILIGATNGALSRGLNIHPLIVTLGIGMIVQGLVLIWTKGFPSGSAPRAVSDFVSIGGSFGPPAGARADPRAGRSDPCRRPGAGSHSLYGRQLYALGSNPGAAPYALIRPLRMWIITFAALSFFAAVARVLLPGFTGSAYGDVGEPYLFQTIASVVVGGAALVGGRGSYVGTLAGVLVLTEINTLLIGLGFQPSAVQAAFGLIILLLVSLCGRERHFRTTV